MWPGVWGVPSLSYAFCEGCLSILCNNIVPMVLKNRWDVAEWCRRERGLPQLCFPHCLTFLTSWAEKFEDYRIHLTRSIAGATRSSKVESIWGKPRPKPVLSIIRCLSIGLRAQFYMQISIDSLTFCFVMMMQNAENMRLMLLVYPSYAQIMISQAIKSSPSQNSQTAGNAAGQRNSSGRKTSTKRLADAAEGV